MQTRRKSLNLGDLGVIAPKRARILSHPSPPETVIESDEPPAKKSKRAYEATSPSHSILTSPSRKSIARSREDKLNQTRAELSPPPSPTPDGINRVNVEGINDDIVIGVIRQIEETGNRPHLVRELAAVLTHTSAAVEKSANQAALISSRLTAYLQRPWPAVNPCPLAKEISTVHPRRLYYYLTTTPRQPLPTHADPLPKPVPRIISPSLSSASTTDENRYLRERQAMSPSPEVDLSSAEFESANGPAPVAPGTFSERNYIPRDRPSYTAQRRSSPPLEMEERDFKQTATALHEQAQARRSSQQDVQMGRDNAAVPKEQGADENVSMSIEPVDSDHRATAELFNLRIPSDQQIEFSSPMMGPQSDQSIAAVIQSKASDNTEVIQDHAMLDLQSEDNQPEVTDSSFSYDNLQCPEDIELDELEDMFHAY